MADPGLILVTGAGGSAGGVGVGNKVVALLRERGRPVRAMVHHDDGRADALPRAARRSSSATSRGPQTSRRPSTRSNGCSSA